MGVKEDFVDLLNDELSTTALTKDDGVTNASYEEFVGNPPHILAKDWLLTKGKDLIFTVDDLRAENRGILKNLPSFEDGRYLIKTWTIAKTGIDGIKLKQKADTEVKRVFKENPDDQCAVSWENADRMVQGTWVYCTSFTVAKVIWATT